MAQQVKLSAKPRSESGRNAVKAVRSRGSIPAVIYGSKSTPSNLEVNRRELEAVLAHAVSENILVELEIQEGGSTSNRLSIIQEIQHHPVRGEVLHVDFHAVSMTEEIEAEVVIEPVGEPIGVKTYGGLLQQSMRAFAISCFPQNLPGIITVDVSHLNVGEAIHVRDIALPKGVTAAADADLTVFLVSEPTVVAETPADAAAAAPEVIKEKKPDASDDKK